MTHLNSSDSIRERTISSLIWKLLERGGNQVVQLAVQVVMARLLLPTDFGALAMILVFVNVGNVVVQSGLGASLIQARRVSDDDYSTVFWISLIISLVLYISVFFAAPSIGSFYAIPSVIWPLRGLCLVLIIGAYNGVLVSLASRDLNFRRIFFAALLSVLLSGLVGVIAAILGKGLWALVAQQICYQIVTAVVLTIKSEWHPRFVFKRRLAKDHFSFGWKLLVAGLLETFYQSLADLIVGKKFSVSYLGVLSQGKKYPMALGSMLDGAIQPVMFAAVARAQEDLNQVRRLVRRALKTTTFLVFPAMAYLAIAAKPLIISLLGEQWLPSVPFFQMYCFIGALLPIHSTNLQALNGLGRSDLFLRLEVVKKCVSVVILCTTALVFQSVFAIVIGYMVSSVLSTFVNAFPNKSIIKYPYVKQIMDIVPAMMITALASGCAWSLTLIGMPNLLLVVAQGVIIVFSYFLLSWVFRVEEFRYIISTYRSFRSKRIGKVQPSISYGK